MTNENQPLDRRQQQIADLRELVDFLDTHPDLPIGNNGIGRVCVTAGADDVGLAEITRIAQILGVEVRDNGVSFDAYREFGTATYRAFYCTRETMRQHREELEVLAAHRKGAGAVES